MWPGFHGNQAIDFGKICGFWRYPNKCITMATRCQIFPKIFFLLKNSQKINFSNYLTIWLVIELSKYMLIRSIIPELVTYVDYYDIFVQRYLNATLCLVIGSQTKYNDIVITATGSNNGDRPTIFQKPQSKRCFFPLSKWYSNIDATFSMCEFQMLNHLITSWFPYDDNQSVIMWPCLHKVHIIILHLLLHLSHS